MITINPTWLDVQPPQSERFCLPRTDRLGATWPVYEEAVPIIPRSDWPELFKQEGRDLAALVKKIKNQQQEGSCASNACAGTGENLQVKQWGEDGWVELSPISLYKRVANSPNSGSTINDNIREIATRGILPVNSAINKSRFKHTMPEVGFYEQYPSGWEETAALFRITEWWDIASVEGMVSAWLRGCPVFYGRSGHAIYMVSATLENGLAVLKYANSWGDWGDSGFGYDTEAFVRSAISSYGAVAPRSVIDWREGLLPKAA